MTINAVHMISDTRAEKLPNPTGLQEVAKRVKVQKLKHDWVG